MNFDVPFTINSNIYEEYKRVVDYMNNQPIASPCLLVYENTTKPCDNCLIDPQTNQSANIYNGVGPISFADYSLCPRCNGRGIASLANTSTIQARIYYSPKEWIKIDVEIKAPEATAMMIGDIGDLKKIERARYAILNSDMVDAYRYRRLGEGVPHGLEKDAYFIQYWEQI